MKTELGRTVADMLENCVPKDMIVLAVDAWVLALMSTRNQVDEVAERRREWDRNYRRKLRGSPPDNADIHPTSTRQKWTARPPDIHPNPPDIHLTQKTHLSL